MKSLTLEFVRPCEGLATHVTHRAVAAREIAANKPPPVGASSTANHGGPPKAKPAPAPVRKDAKKSLKGVLVKKKPAKPASPPDAQYSAAAEVKNDKRNKSVEEKPEGGGREAKRRKVSAS